MRVQTMCAALVLAACANAAAQTAVAPHPQPAQPPSLAEILEHSPASDWRPLDPDSTLYMELPTGRVVIELSSDFSPEHVANVRALARAHYWDGAAITRVQDNYVTQWGRVEGSPHDRGAARANIAAPEYDRPDRDLPFTRLPDPDSYARQTGFTNGFWAARDGAGKTWMPHCYGAIGVGRDNPPNTGDGSELYVVIGQAPRHLDRNLAMVGRVVQGMDLLSGLKRGTGALGFYETPAERTPINSIRLASDVPEAQRVNLEALRTDSATFQAVIESRRFRRESFFVNPTGHINMCNVPLPVRVMPTH
ncbi:MAG: peptidylprolyl isomerase [Proteobacteria bacterium]|nr:peptidylprolyl isomerase [Pseudomonadota bacterium]